MGDGLVDAVEQFTEIARLFRRRRQHGRDEAGRCLLRRDRPVGDAFDEAHGAVQDLLPQPGHVPALRFQGIEMIGFECHAFVPKSGNTSPCSCQ